MSSSASGATMKALIGASGRPARPPCASPGVRAIHQVEVEQAVLIEVDPGAPRAHGFNKVFLTGSRILMAEGYAGGLGDIHEPDRAAGGRCEGSLPTGGQHSGGGPASKPRRVTPEPAFMNTSLHQRKQATPAPSREE